MGAGAQAGSVRWEGKILLFLKKKKQKDFLLCCRGAGDTRAPIDKSFWFFFSKKNTLLWMNILSRQRGQELLRRCAQEGMAPGGGDVAQWQEDEGAQVRAGVRQDGIGRRADQSVHVYDVEVERAGGVGFATLAALRGFDFLQPGEQPVRGDIALRPDDAVDESGLAGGRDRRRRIPAGADSGGQAGQVENAAQRALGDLQWRLAGLVGQICTQGDVDQNFVAFLAGLKQDAMSTAFGAGSVGVEAALIEGFAL
jgi:hypothetical protein